MSTGNGRIPGCDTFDPTGNEIVLFLVLIQHLPAFDSFCTPFMPKAPENKTIFLDLHVLDSYIYKF